MDNSILCKQDALDRSSSLTLPFPGNVTMCYPPQPSPLSDGSQSSGSYLVPPSMTSPSSCLTLPTQQMYSNYPSPYYRSMLGSQQSYYGTILPSPGNHSSAFYGAFYNSTSPSVYSSTGHASLNPMNYYPSSLYMQSHETMWNPNSQPPHSSKRPYSYESTTSLLPSCSKVSASTSTSLPLTVEDIGMPDEATLSLSEPNTSETPAVLESSTKETEFEYEDLARPLSKAETLESIESSVNKEESEEEDKEDSSSYSSCSDSYISEEEMALISNHHVLDEITEDILHDNSFGDIQDPKDYQFVDKDLQCLLCNNFDHLIPRLDIATKLEPVVGENISRSSVLLCTQCDLMLERYLSLEKEVHHLQTQIQSMYQNNKQLLVNSLKEIDYRDSTPGLKTHSNQDACLDQLDTVLSPTASENSPILRDDSESLLSPDQNQIESTLSEPLLTTDSSIILLPETESKINPSDNLTDSNSATETSLQSEKCTKEYSDQKDLKRHSNSEKFEERCELCAETFESKSTWRRHLQLHKEKKKIKCKECDQQFVRRSHYIYHVKVKHSSRDFKCEICDKEFISNGSLKTHLRIHTGEKPFVCQTCGRSFNVNSNLLAHIPKCSGQLAFKCQECCKAFGSKSLFVAHMKAHQGEFAVTCDICGVGFAKKSHLTAHQRIHTKEKPFQCPICSKSFSNLGNCNSHAKTHSDERKFVCEICGKKFGRRQGLETHLNRHTGTKPYRCTHLNCDKAFHDPSNLINHKKTHKRAD